MGAKRRLWPRIVGGLLALILIALVAGYWYMRPLLLTATGYAAHNACALEFVAGRDDPASDLPPNPLVPYLRTEIVDGHAESSILGVLAKQRAFPNDGYGCTVGSAAPDLPPPTAVDSANPITQGPVVTPDGALADALGLAFGDDLSPDDRGALGTRAVVVVRDGEVVAERYADGFSEATPQLGWSMAKSVTNLLVGRLALAGTVDVDAEVDLEWRDRASEAITLDHLLRMRSGLGWDETYDLGTPITAMLYLEPDMGAFAASQPQVHPVGAFNQYSSGSTNIACHALLDADGRGADLPRAELFAPLGLTTATWEPDAAGVPVCSSYLWATPREFAAIGQFALDDGVIDGERFLPEGWMTESTTAEAVPEAEDPHYASSWWTNRRPDGSLVHEQLPADTYWMQGHDGQRTFVVPSAGVVVVRMGFSPGAEDLRVVDLVADVLASA